MSRAGETLEKLSLAATQWAGSSWAFGVAAGVILVWGLTGPIFGFSDTWQLVINTGTTIVTFLMVFLIQRAQNKESKAIHLKLNELVAATQGASNHLIDVENLTEEEIEVLHQSLLRARPARLEAGQGARVTLDRGSPGTEQGEGTRTEKVGARLNWQEGCFSLRRVSRVFSFRCGREFPIRSGA